MSALRCQQQRCQNLAALHLDPCGASHIAQVYCKMGCWGTLCPCGVRKLSWILPAGRTGVCIGDHPALLPQGEAVHPVLKTEGAQLTPAVGHWK